METYILWLTIFVGLLAVALVVQAVSVFLIYRTIANLVEETVGWRQMMYERIGEIIANVEALTAAVKEGGQQIIANVSAISQDARREMQKFEKTADAISDTVTRNITNQVVRMDHLVTSVVDDLERLGRRIKRAAFQPIRELTALFAGFRTAVDYLRFSHKGNGRKLAGDVTERLP